MIIYSIINSYYQETISKLKVQLAPRWIAIKFYLYLLTRADISRTYNYTKSRRKSFSYGSHSYGIIITKPDLLLAHLCLSKISTFLLWFVNPKIWKQRETNIFIILYVRYVGKNLMTHMN